MCNRGSRPDHISALAADPEFTDALRMAEGQAISEAARALLADLLANHATLRELRDNHHGMDFVRLRAAVELDAAALRWRQAGDLEKRILALEEAAKNVKS